MMEVMIVRCCWQSMLMFDVLAMVQVDVDVDVVTLVTCWVVRRPLFVGFKSCNYSVLPVKVEFYSSTI